MTRSHFAPLDETTGSTAAGTRRHRHAAAPPERFSLLRLSAADRALGAIFIIALLWAAVYWALH